MIVDVTLDLVRAQKAPQKSEKEESPVAKAGIPTL